MRITKHYASLLGKPAAIFGCHDSHDRRVVEVALLHQDTLVDRCEETGKDPIAIDKDKPEKLGELL